MRFNIEAKLIILLLLVALLPLTLFGFIAISQLRATTATAVKEGNARVSVRVAEQIDQYVNNAIQLVAAAAESINHADLSKWQKERVLKNYCNRFDQLSKLTLFDLNQTIISTNLIDSDSLTQREQIAYAAALQGKRYLSSIYLRENLSPALLVALPVTQLTQLNGVLIAELNLMHMSYLVDSIKIGAHGIVHIIDETGRLLATGAGERKKQVFEQAQFESAPIIEQSLQANGHVFRNAFGTEVLGIGTKIGEPLHWDVIVEQPIAEAYALAIFMTYLLLSFIACFLLLALVVGFYGGKRGVVNPIQQLIQATQALAAGNLDYQVKVVTGDEFEQLGAAFNRMTEQLKTLQARLVREEKHAMFGRIASGLAHDLKHPIQAIENTSRLMDTMHEDPEFRETFAKTVQREFAKINQFLEGLHNLTHEVVYQPTRLQLHSLIEDAIATFEIAAHKKEIAIERRRSNTEDIWVNADIHSLNRAISNLISNAIEAMDHQGRLTITVEADATTVAIRIADTGRGIEPERIASLFDDFVTTKRRGLGLGLALTKKIIEQHSGTITVTSQPGVGTCFTITLPR